MRKYIGLIFFLLALSVISVPVLGQIIETDSVMLNDSLYVSSLNDSYKDIAEDNTSYHIRDSIQVSHFDYTPPKIKGHIFALCTCFAIVGDFPGKFKTRFPDTYDPQWPVFWWGPSSLKRGFMSSDLKLRKGISHSYDSGMTLLQISMPLYHHCVGWSSGLQLLFSSYSFSNKTNIKEINIKGLRVPLLIGYNSPRKSFSFQTGLAFNVITHDETTYKDEGEEISVNLKTISAEWMTVIGIYPVTISINQGITPIIKLNNGTKGYTSSITVGLDLWWLHRIGGH